MRSIKGKLEKKFTSEFKIFLFTSSKRELISFRRKSCLHPHNYQPTNILDDDSGNKKENHIPILKSMPSVGQPVTIIPQPTPMSYQPYIGQTNMHSNELVNGTRSNASQYEANWRSKFPRLPVLILSIIQFILTLLIFILEIASIAIAASYRPTGVGV